MVVPVGGFWPTNARSAELYGDRALGCIRQRVPGDGANSVTASLNTAGFICRRLVTSVTHTLRPCVAITSSCAVVGWANSWTATVGRLAPSLPQLAPRLADTHAPNSVPTYRMFGLVMSSRRQRVLPKIGRLALSDFHELTKSSVTIA